MILRQPLHQRRRHQQQLAALTPNEISSHPGSVLNPADSTDIPTASHGCSSRVDRVAVTAGDPRIVPSPQPTAADRRPVARSAAVLKGRKWQKRFAATFGAPDHGPERERASVCQRHVPPTVQAPPKASARAPAQLPYRSMTVDGAGHSPACSRLSGSPPRRRACVRDQSYEDGAAP